MQKLEVQSARMSRCLLVALSNGELRVYNEKNLISVYNTPAPISGIWFGKYGREDNTLITVTKSGAVEIKILPRTAGPYDCCRQMREPCSEGQTQLM